MESREEWRVGGGEGAVAQLFHMLESWATNCVHLLLDVEVGRESMKGRGIELGGGVRRGG